MIAKETSTEKHHPVDKLVHESASSLEGMVLLSMAVAFTNSLTI